MVTDRSVGCTIPDGRWQCQAGTSTSGPIPRQGARVRADALAGRLEGTAVTANCLHPGAVATALGHNNGPVAKLIARALKPFFRTPEQGAATSIHLAASPAVDGISGRYFVNCREARSSRASYDVATARRLWQVSAGMTGLG